MERTSTPTPIVRHKTSIRDETTMHGYGPLGHGRWSVACTCGWTRWIDTGARDAALVAANDHIRGTSHEPWCSSYQPCHDTTLAANDHKGGPMTTYYRIVRMYFEDHPTETIDTSMYAEDIEGLTLEEARAWCSDPETSSSTCELPENIARTKRYGPWFDGYEEI